MKKIKGRLDTSRTIWGKNYFDKITPLVVGEESDGRRQIFWWKPHAIQDNFFSRNSIIERCGEKGFGMMRTVQKGCLPKGIPIKYFAKVLTPQVEKNKVSLFNHQIIAVKRCVVYDV